MSLSTEKNNLKFISSWIFLSVIAVIVIVIRLYNISERPLHNDEAVNSIKFKYLLEQNNYTYDPADYHGPSLYYLTLLEHRLLGIESLKDSQEINLRGISVLFSSLLFLILIFLRKKLDPLIILFSTLFLIVSPYLNFYSRYYIHEILFAVLSIFLLLSFYLYHIKKTAWNAVIVGLLAGLIFATKETSIIIFFGIALGILLTRLYKNIPLKHWLYLSFSFVIIWITLYSSLFTNSQGILDSILTYQNYLVKSASDGKHIQPWYYYFKIFLFNNFEGSLISEIIIILFGIGGIYKSFKNDGNDNVTIFYKLLSIYTLTYFIIITTIPYKTPWTALPSWVGMLFLAGYGAYSLLKHIAETDFEVIFIVFLIGLILNLAYQSFITSYEFPSEESNPYTYSQPTEEIYTLTDKINELIELDESLKIGVIVKDSEYWPLPWYFRNADHVLWSEVPTNEISNYDVIITDPIYIDEISNLIYENGTPGEIDLYVPLLSKEIQIRPGKFLRTFIKYDLLPN